MSVISSNEFQLLMEALHEIRDEMKIANGRTRKNESAIAALEKQAEGNVCMLHGARLAVLESQIGDIRSDNRKAIAVSAGATAGLMAIAEGVWAWFQNAKL